jgi:hypothetical protein
MIQTLMVPGVSNSGLPAIRAPNYYPVNMILEQVVLNLSSRLQHHGEKICPSRRSDCQADRLLFGLPNKETRLELTKFHRRARASLGLSHRCISERSFTFHLPPFAKLLVLRAAASSESVATGFDLDG